MDGVFKRFHSIKHEYTIQGPAHYTYVYVSATESMSIADRADLILNLEKFLMNEVDPNIRVWHVPIGDKNSLRNLRGVKLS